MIVRFGGGNSGIAEYLENGIKQGRTLSRDELDRRVILEGDLALTDRIIDSIQNRGQERYLHITLSFREDEISNDTLQDIVEDYREILMSAYSEDEFNFYAEAHLPKIKRVKDERTGEMIVRKPHVHIVIPEVNLLTLKKLSPVGLVEKNIRHLDSIQEFINHKYNLETPKDYVRNADMHYANVLSRIKGDFYGEKQHELKTLLVDEIANGKINTVSEFQERLANFGEVKIRNKGKDKQYFSVKIDGNKKFTNLNHAVFKESFIKDKVLPYNKQSIEDINTDILDWKYRVSREIKHVNFATQSFRKLYAEADPEEKSRLLIDRETKYEERYRGHKHLHKIGRKRDYQPNLDKVKRQQSRSTSRETSRLSSLSYSNLVYRKNQRSRNVKGFLPEDEYAYLRNRKPRNNFRVRRALSKRGANGGRLGNRRSFSQINRGVPTRQYSKSFFYKDIERRSFTTEFERFQGKNNKSVSKFSESNSLSFVARSHRSEQEKKDELAKFAEIRKNIDPNSFLEHLKKVYELDPSKHTVTYAKDGSPRFKFNKRNLNASDFLTKYLNLEWNEAKLVLLYVYENQASNKLNEQPNIDIQKNIKAFSFEVHQYEKDIKFILHNLNIDNRNSYRAEKKRIYSRFSEPRIRNQELTIASFRAMQRQERINYIETIAAYNVKNERLLFQQRGYTKLEDSTMALKESLNIALGNEFGRIAPADEQISFSDNFKQQQILLKRQLQEQQQSQAAETKQDKQETPQRVFTSKALEEVMKLNNLGVAKKKNGDIEYKRLYDGKTVCTDVGNQMLISKEMQSSENIKTFLELAIDKYGNELKINGSKEFKEMVIESAAANNLSIILKPAVLQEQLIERRKELALEARAESIDSISNEAGKQLKEDVQQAEAKQQASEAQQQASEAQQQASEAQQQASEAQQQASEAKQQASEAKQQASEAKQQASEAKQQASEAKQQASEAKQQASEAKQSDVVKSIDMYKMEFKYNKEASVHSIGKIYDVTINGQPAAQVVKKEPQLEKTLEKVIAAHKDLQQKGITSQALASGSIEITKKLSNEVKITKPEAKAFDLKGNTAQAKTVKSNDFSL